MTVVFPIAETALQSVHHCEARQEGSWIVYTCKRCPGYERKIHQDTGQIAIKGPSPFSVEHICDRRGRKRQ